jgi:hypothetical protein
MPNENIFIDGMLIKPPREGIPSFIKGSISVKCDEFKVFMDKHANNGWLNIDIKKSKAGKLYLSLNTYKKETKVAEETVQEELPPEEYPF